MEIKFDGYRIQMRVADGNVTLKTRKGLDWTARYPSIATPAAELPDAIIDGEICALDNNGAPDFAALQAALSEGRPGHLSISLSIFFSTAARICGMFLSLSVKRDWKSFSRR